MLPLRFYLEDTEPDAAPCAIQLDTEDEPLVVETRDGSVTAHLGRAEEPDLVLSGPARPVGRLMLGRITLAEARKRGVRTKGDTRLLRRLTVRSPKRRPSASPRAATAITG